MILQMCGLSLPFFCGLSLLSATTSSSCLVSARPHRGRASEQHAPLSQVRTSTISLLGIVSRLPAPYFNTHMLLSTSSLHATWWLCSLLNPRFPAGYPQPPCQGHLATTQCLLRLWSRHLKRRYLMLTRTTVTRRPTSTAWTVTMI